SIFQTHIVKVSADCQRIEHALFLCRCGIQTEFESFYAHTPILLQRHMPINKANVRFHPRAQAHGFPAPENYKKGQTARLPLT
ncbi:MAG: hypothetical protein ABI970_26870, partial [Chloroflexota bacterium]